MSSIIKQGTLEKEGGGFKHFQTRFFILTEQELNWFKPEDLRGAQGSFKLGEITDVTRQVGERQGRKHCFSVSISRKQYMLAAASREEQADWIASLHPSTQGSFAAKVLSKTGTTTQAPELPGGQPSGEDQVLAAVKAAAKQITGGDAERKSTVLIPIKKADDDEAAVDGGQAPGGGGPTSPTSPGAFGLGASATKYAVVEVFIGHGLRVSGPISNQMLNILGQGVASDRKKVDKRGWYCDKMFGLCSLIQTFVNSGWVLHRLSQATSFTPFEPANILPVNLAVFARGGGVNPISMSDGGDARLFAPSSTTGNRPASVASFRGAMSATGSGNRGLPNTNTITSYLTPSEEAELRVLMDEFEIPLDLLELPADVTAAV